MRRFSYWLRDRRFWSVIGVSLLLALTFLSTRVLKTGLVWVGVVGVIALLALGGAWLWRRRQARKSSDRIADMIDQQADQAVSHAEDDRREEIEQLRVRMHEAVKTIKTSKLGDLTGRAALYELPWYMVIGNPAAGKSTAIVNSGLRFPFSDKVGNIIQGIGGTRNCDWFFTTEGILLDTAGRYSVYEEDRKEWLGFLNLLKKTRPKAPINGIVIAASIAELTQNKPEYVINLAKNLRQRVQELTDNLEIYAPVYVLFTKVDLIAGFIDFFEDSDRFESERVWGSTLPYNPEGKTDLVASFDERFEELYDGLREMSVARMSANRGLAMSPGLLTFPYEFAAIKPALRAFVATLFEDNPFQYKPVFRGFYFTSAVQEGSPVSQIPEKIANRFALNLNPLAASARMLASRGFFLKDLFSKVVFADSGLVRQHSTRRKRQLRLAAFFGGVLILAGLLGGWTWSYFNNQKLLANAEADLQKVVRLQEGKIDLASRFESMLILQDRIEQLRRFREETPVSLGLGLYQGDKLEGKLRNEYFHGINELLLKPVSANLENFLGEVNANAALLKPSRNAQTGAVDQAAEKPAEPAGQYKESSPANMDDAYNALKTYIMLSSHEHLDSGHLNDQITRFWRTWVDNNRGTLSREQAIRQAESVLTFFLAQIGQPDFPIIEPRLALVDQTRDTLRNVVKGIPARERVYAEIKLRASTRFPAVTVARVVGEANKDVLAGSYVVSGAFTHDAWKDYVQDAIKDAANKELQTNDWVLKTSVRDDLTLEGSPEQVEKILTEMYKTEYVKEWSKFVRGVTVLEFKDFNQALEELKSLGNPRTSPINKLMDTIYRETAWDNPSLLNQSMENAKQGVWEWIKRLFSRASPGRVNVDVSLNKDATDQLKMGPIGKEFAAVAHLMVSRSDNPDSSLFRGYLNQLSKVAGRFGELKNAGDIGPGAKTIVQQTFSSGSELSEALRYVDDQMLSGIADSSKETLRPMLVRPLIQSFAVILKPTEQELNKVWLAQVYEPFKQALADKYPFMTNSRVEATSTEIAKVFGSEGSIAKFSDKELSALVVRRGDVIYPRTWAEMSISLAPQFIADFPHFVAPLNTDGQAAGASQEAQTVFQILPVPVPGVSEYTIEIDGQILRYRNGTQKWVNFFWPNTAGEPGVKITAVTYDGRSVEILREPGHFGLEKMINSARKDKQSDGSFQLTWANDNSQVKANLRIISSPFASGDGSSREQGLKGMQLPSAIAGE
jgi:type VI secretion system protein ImpL